MTVAKGLSLGRVLTDDGNGINLSSADLALIAGTGCQVARVELRLTSAHHTWDTQLLSNYASAISQLMAPATSGGGGVRRVIGLLDASIVAGATQDQWEQNNSENGGSTATATNPFIDAYVQAVAQVVLALGDVVDAFEVWNEPNAYKTRSSTVYSGATYMYPSVYAGLLVRAYEVIAGLCPAAAVVTGGLFAHNIGGMLSHPSASTVYLSALCAELAARGCGTGAPWPFAAVGYHLYLDQGGALGAGHVTTYVGWITQTLAWWQVPAAQSSLLVTETAWSTHNVSAAVQAANLSALYAECATLPAVSGVLWFLLSDNAAANLYYGLTTAVTDTPPEVPKPAYSAYQAVP